MTVLSPDTTGASLFQRLRFTPMRDLVRLRLSARLDFHGRIAAAGLSSSTAEVIEQVMRRSRLTRLEQSEVLDELISHFADGEEAGASTEDLKTSFGDPEQAGRLIGRAQRRLRPWPYQVMMSGFKALALLVAILVLFYVVQWARYMMIEPSPSVNYLARLNAPTISLPDDERAWPVYREGLLSLTAPPLVLRGGDRSPGSENWAVIERWLDRNTEAIATFRSASSRPAIGIVMGFGVTAEDAELFPNMPIFDESDQTTIADEPIFGVLIPHLSTVRTVSAILQDDAMLQAERDNADVAVADLEAIARMANQMIGSPFLIGDLVGHAILARGCDATMEILTRHPDLFEERHYASLAHAYSSINDHGSMECIDGERSAFLDLVQRIYSDDGDGDGRLTREGLALLDQVSDGSRIDDHEPITTITGPALCTIAASRRDIVETYDSMLAVIRSELNRPLWKRDFRNFDKKIVDMRNSTLGSIRYHPIDVLTPHFGKAASVADLSLMRRDAVLLALVLHRERARTGAWPTDIESAVDALGLSFPVDRFDGQPLRTALIGDEMRVYSIGNNHADDGGRRCSEIQLGVPDHMVHQYRPPSGASTQPAGDWVFFPAPPREQSFLDDPSITADPLYHFPWMTPVESGSAPSLEG